MTEQEKLEIISELEKRFEDKYRGCILKEDTKAVLKIPRDKWFGDRDKMHSLFGNIIYWQVWELIRKLTCIVCGKQYVRHLADVEYADEVAEKICQFVFDLKTELIERSKDNA